MAKKKVNRKKDSVRKSSAAGHVSRDVIREQVRAEVRREAEIKCVKRRLCWFDEMNRVMIFLAILGVLISLYLTWLHFNPSEKAFCNINDKFDCNTVNTSAYSVLLIPVASIGLLGYLGFILLGIAILKRWKITQKHLHIIGIGMAAIGFAFSLYLAYVQKYILGKWCVMCIASFVVITLILLCTVGSYAYCVWCRKKLDSLRAEPDSRCRDY